MAVVAAPGAVPADEGAAPAGEVPDAEGDMLRDPPERIEEIVVTSSKRQADVQDTAIAISAFTGSQLDAAGVGQLQDLAFQVPNLHYGVEFGLARITIRGVSTALGADASTAFHVDGVYQNDPGLPATLTFFDVARVEVLRGPQGTLYGRNATGGAINAVSNPPSDELELFGDVQVGTYEQRLGRFALNVPVVEDRVATRLSGFFELRDGAARLPRPATGADFPPGRIMAPAGRPIGITTDAGCFSRGG